MNSKKEATRNGWVGSKRLVFFAVGRQGTIEGRLLGNAGYVHIRVFGRPSLLLHGLEGVCYDVFCNEKWHVRSMY